METPTRRRNLGSRVLHCLLAGVFLLLVILTIASLSMFALKNDQIHRNVDASYEGHCILYAEHGNDHPYLKSDSACQFAIYGEALVALMALIFMVWLLIKTITGIKVMTPLAVFELIFVVLMFSLGLADSCSISVGLAITCDEFGKFEDGHCSSYTVPISGGVHFHNQIRQAEIAAWLGTGLLLLLSVFYVIMVCAYCWRCTHNNRPTDERSARLLPKYDRKKDYSSNASTNLFD